MRRNGGNGTNRIIGMTGVKEAVWKARIPTIWYQGKYIQKRTNNQGRLSQGARGALAPQYGSHTSLFGKEVKGE